MRKKKVIIIGGGASGLTAAVFAAEGGADVTVLEHTASIGKKLLSTGNGRCNYTNSELKDKSAIRKHYHSLSNIGFAEKVIENFGYEDTLSFFKRIGVEPKFRKYSYDDSSYVYPASDQASSVLRALKQQADAHNVRFITSCNIYNVAHINTSPCTSLFVVDAENASYRSDALIVCSGGGAAPKTGSDGSGFNFPCAFGHTMWGFLPSLCPLKCPEHFFKDIKGVRHECNVKLFISSTGDSEHTEETRLAKHNESTADNFGFITDDKLEDTYESFGEVQFTDYGISGIPVFQISRYASIALKIGKAVRAELDLMPGMSKAELSDLLYERSLLLSDRTLEYFFNGLLNDKLSKLILSLASLKPFMGVYTLERKDTDKLSRLLKHFSVTVEDTAGFDSAQCTVGGIDAGEIDPDTMESEVISDLYFAGELIDIDGDCGGYNLQWAWSTGAIAGKNAADYHKKKAYPEIFENNVMKDEK